MIQTNDQGKSVALTGHKSSYMNKLHASELLRLQLPDVYKTKTWSDDWQCKTIMD